MTPVQTPNFVNGLQCSVLCRRVRQLSHVLHSFNYNVLNLKNQIKSIYSDSLQNQKKKKSCKINTVIKQKQNAFVILKSFIFLFED